MAQREAPQCDGRLAQLGERCLRKAEVGSSNLLPSIATKQQIVGSKITHISPSAVPYRVC
jgi:hypothetical protein